MTWAIENDWLMWMKEVQGAEILATGLFYEYRIMRLLEADDTDGPTYAIQYMARNADDYNRFISEFSADFQQKGFQKWGDQFIAFRSVLQVVN